MRRFQYFLFSLLLLCFPQHLLAQQFSLVNQTSHLIFSHNNGGAEHLEPIIIAAGGAVADYDFDGYPDFYLLGGVNRSNALFKNDGDGSFTNVAAAAGVDLFNILGSGPTFADVDGDGDLDLLVFSINKWRQIPGSSLNDIENRPRLFKNQGDGTFVDDSINSGFYSGMPSFSGSLADLDLDGDLDLFMTHWSSYNETTSKQYFWRNDGTGQFTDVTIEYLGLPQNAQSYQRWTFTPHITDINEDGWLDVLLTSDFETSRIFYSTGFASGQPAYLVSRPPFLTDENGMGSAVADYDNDGDLDWFVTSVWDPDGQAEANWGVTGNRLYRNTGLGVFEDATDEAGIRHGYWGWGACFADFNNDGHLDIYHENGFPNTTFAQEFINDPSRLYMANGDGTFTESSTQAGLMYTGQGRGISCVDYDLDGDLDIMIMPNDDEYQLYRNNSDNTNNYLSVNLFDTGQNPYAINAKITITTADSTQLREITSSNNYVSNNPLQQHFGLGQSTAIDNIAITWPDGVSQVINTNITVNQITSIGRYCHTRFFNQVATDLNSHDITVYLHDLAGNPLSAHPVDMKINQGPNTGLIQSNVSDVTGGATFSLNPGNQGTDRITFEFIANGQPQVCHALIKWFDDLIYTDGFEL